MNRRTFIGSLASVAVPVAPAMACWRRRSRSCATPLAPIGYDSRFFADEDKRQVDEYDSAGPSIRTATRIWRATESRGNYDILEDRANADVSTWTAGERFLTPITAGARRVPDYEDPSTMVVYYDLGNHTYPDGPRQTYRTHIVCTDDRTVPAGITQLKYAFPQVSWTVAGNRSSSRILCRLSVIRFVGGSLSSPQVLDLNYVIDSRVSTYHDVRNGTAWGPGNRGRTYVVAPGDLIRLFGLLKVCDLSGPYNVHPDSASINVRIKTEYS
jgi:hypothetical protein